MATDKISFMQIALRPPRDLISPPVPIVPFADWDYYYTTKPLKWRANDGVASNPAEVTVPTGFVTDLASIPTVFWSELPPTARYSYPAIIHDYLYWFQPCTREEADAILEAAMKDMDVSSVKIELIHGAVRLGGGRAWAKNTESRRAGEKRVLKDFPTEARTTWDEWKQRIPTVFL